MTGCVPNTDESYYICSTAHHSPEKGGVACSVHDRLSESMHITSSDVVLYDVIVRGYEERGRKVGHDIIVRRQAVDETLCERGSYTYICRNENIESASENIQNLIETKTPLTHEQSITAAGIVVDYILTTKQRVS